MTRHDPKVSFLQMRDTVQEALSLSKNKSRNQLEDDRVLNLALTRLLEVVGEAANRVPSDIQERFPHLPWSQIIGLRNRLIHAYDQVDFDILWKIVSEDLPLFLPQLEEIVGKWDVE
jgi:uncharacterized protein with HEPN domain